MSMELCQTQSYIYIDSQSIKVDLNNEALETLSNLYIIFNQKIFFEPSRDENK